MTIKYLDICFMNLRLVVTAVFFFFYLSNEALDRTVGLLKNDSLAFNGYTLFSPTSANSTFLIDNCGRKINEWTSTIHPGMVAYLLEDGSIVRAGRIFANFGAGGSGGRIEIISWDNLVALDL